MVHRGGIWKDRNKLWVLSHEDGQRSVLTLFSTSLISFVPTGSAAISLIIPSQRSTSGPRAVFTPSRYILIISSFEYRSGRLPSRLSE